MTYHLENFFMSLIAIHTSSLDIYLLKSFLIIGGGGDCYCLILSSLFLLDAGLFFFQEFLLFLFIFIYLFLAVLVLRFCARAFSSCGKREATLHRGARASHHRGLSCCGAQAPDAQAQ